MTHYTAADCGRFLHGALRCASFGRPPGGAISDLQDRCPDFSPETAAPQHSGFMNCFNLSPGGP